MKTFILLFFTFLFLSLGYCSISSSIDRLSQVSLITNAISIQADILHDNLHYPEVVSELLKVQEGQLIKILEANTSEILSVIRGLSDRDKKLNLSTIGNLKGTRERLLLLAETIDNLEALKSINNSKNLNSFKSVIRNQSTDFTLKLNCPEAITNSIIDYWMVSEDETTGDKEVITQEFKNKKEEIKTCFNGLQKHKKLLEEKFLWEFQGIQRIKEIIDFSKLYNDQKTLSSIFQEIKSKLAEIPEFLAQNAGLQLSKVTTALSVADKEPSEPYHTLGFPKGRRDLDLTNTWFLEQFANLSTDNVIKMEEALEGFRRFSDKVNALSVSWQELNNSKIDKEFVETLSKLDGLSIDKNATDKADEHWVQCHKGAVPMTFDSSSFQTAYQSWEKVINGVKSITDNIDKVNKLSDKKALIRYLDTLDHRNYQYFSKGAEALKKILEVEEALITDMKNTDLGDKVSINFLSHLETPKLLEVLECMKKHVDLHKIVRILDFLQEAQHLQNQSATDTLKLVQKLRAFQSAFEATKITPKTMINPIFHLISYQRLSRSLMEAVKVLKDIRHISDNGVSFSDKLNWTLISDYADKGEKEVWKNPEVSRIDLIGNEQDESFLSVISVFDKLSDFKGFPVKKSTLKEMSSKLREDGYLMEAEEIDRIEKLNLDFSRASLQKGKEAVIQMRQFFNDTFHLNPIEDSEDVTDSGGFIDPLDFIESVLLIIGILSLPISCWFFVFGDVFGIRKASDRILNRKPNKKTLERRWRYSLFMDRNSNGDNVLFDAISRGDHNQLKKYLKKGAYVNCYDALGNTPLHTAIYFGDSEAIQLLIHAGADKKLLNADNKSSEELITLPVKTFPLITPDKFPTDKFQIYLDPRISEELKYWFKDRFLQNVITEPSASMTHYIVKTTDKGTLETDSLDLIIWILSGIIIVKDEWIIDCLKNDKVISEDYQYLVDKISYHGTEYKTVLEWSRARAKGEFPFLHGFDVVIMIRSQRKAKLYNRLITSLGATVLPAPLPPSAYNPGYHPILHQSMGPVLIISDKKTDKKDDKIYTRLTEQEFIDFLFEMKIERNEDKNPVEKYKRQ